VAVSGACVAGVLGATTTQHNTTGMPVVHARRNAGYSLLEIMVCLVIIALAITAFVAAITKNVQLEAMNSETNVAVNTAKAIVESVRGMTYAELTEGAVPSTFEATGLTNDGHTLRLMDSNGSTQVGHVTITENPQCTCKTAQVDVIWRSITGSDRRIMLMTEVTNY